ncbi:hypothetical protein FPOAC2_14096 [Fusarium poae]
MSPLSQLNAEQVQVLDIVRGFHEYFSSAPPFKEGERFALPHGLITVPFPPEMGGLKTECFDDMYERVSGLLAKQQESGPTGFKHQLAEPKADVWVLQNIAAVFVGWSASMDGRGEFIHTVHLCTLHRQSDDIPSDGNPWRISALVDNSGMDILRTGIESIDSFDAKSYEYRIEFLGVRFDANRMWCFSFDIRIEHGTFYSLSNRTGPSVRSKIDRFGRTSDAARFSVTS